MNDGFGPGAFAIDRQMHQPFTGRIALQYSAFQIHNRHLIRAYERLRHPRGRDQNPIIA